MTGETFMEWASCLIPLAAIFYMVWRYMNRLVTQDDERKVQQRHQHASASVAVPVEKPTAHVQRLASKHWLPIVNDMPDMYPHLFMVGKTRSGKTLTAQAILSQRSGIVTIIDPKDRPGKWGDVRAIALDDDLSYASIEAACQEIIVVLKSRQKAMNRGATGFEPLTVLIDELPTVVDECPSAIEMFKKIGQIGAELRVRLIALSQSDRVKTLGLSGEGDSRDNFLYLAFGNKAHSLAPVIRGDYPCIAKLDSGLAHFDTRDVPRLAAHGIALTRVWSPVETTEPVPENAENGAEPVPELVPENAVPADTSARNGSSDDHWIMTLIEAGHSRNDVAKIIGGNRRAALDRIKRVVG